MDTKVVGIINIALVWGLLQFVSTFTIALLLREPRRRWWCTKHTA
jgi:multisubunit Na+/H+ antiporter MnhF subunit